MIFWLPSITYAANEEVVKTTENFNIAKDYFSDILNAQLVIFSVIVAGIIALSWIYNYKISKDEIKKEVENKFKEEWEKIKDKDLEFKARLVSMFAENKNELTGIRAEVYRSHGNLWQSEKNFSVAILWWLRASREYASTSEDKLARICLDSARRCLENIEHAYEIDSDNIGEIQLILGELDEKKYKMEKEGIFETLKDKIKTRT